MKIYKVSLVRRVLTFLASCCPRGFIPCAIFLAASLLCFFVTAIHANGLQLSGDDLAAADITSTPGVRLTPPQNDGSCGWLCNTGRRLKWVFDNGGYDVYVPIHTYHFRYAYTQEQINRYQEQPWGLGLGKSLWNESGNRESIGYFVFQDSHFYPQHNLVYDWDAVWGSPAGVRVGIGALFAITTREDIGHYTPFPSVVPVFGLWYGRVSFKAIVLPRIFNITFFYAVISL